MTIATLFLIIATLFLSCDYISFKSDLNLKSRNDILIFCNYGFYI